MPDDENDYISDPEMEIYYRDGDRDPRCGKVLLESDEECDEDEDDLLEEEPEEYEAVDVLAAADSQAAIVLDQTQPSTPFARNIPGVGWANLHNSPLAKKTKISDACACDDDPSIKAIKKGNAAADMKRRAYGKPRNLNLQTISNLILSNHPSIFIVGRKLSSFMSRLTQGCNNQCGFDGKCLSYLDLENSFQLMQTFWGREDEPAKLPKERKASISNIFDVCKAGFDDKKRLHFTITDKTGKPRRICESSFLFMLGYIDTPNASDANPQWQFFKRVKLGDANPMLAKEIIESSKGIKKTTKRMDAEGFIKGLMMIYFGETLATMEGATADGDIKDIKILPYESLSQLYEEYNFDHEIREKPESCKASYKVFRTSFNVLKDRVRLLRCKGSFPTCDVCNTSLEMLRDTKMGPCSTRYRAQVSATTSQTATSRTRAP
jgi:hypothetical protein